MDPMAERHCEESATVSMADDEAPADLLCKSKLPGRAISK